VVQFEMHHYPDPESVPALLSAVHLLPAYADFARASL